MNKRIMIIGPGGAGKSELSFRLEDVLHLPLYHLDNIWWKKDKTNISREEFDRKLNEIIDQDEWIIDGDYSRTYKMRMEKADTIIFLDYPLEVCLKGVESRLGKERKDIPFIDYEFDPEFKGWIYNWFLNTRPYLLELLEEYKKTRKVIFLSSHDEADKYIQDLVR